MGTSATVSVKLSDDKVYTTRVNWDGYLSWVGKILNEKFNDNDLSKVLDMIKGGEIRSFDNRKPELVEYYEDDKFPKSYPIKYNNDGDIIKEGYDYIFMINDNGSWEWYVEFDHYHEDEDCSEYIFMDLKTALEKYGDKH